MAVQANIELVGGIPTRDQKVVAAQQRYGGRQRSLYKAVVERAFQKGIERFQRDPIILPREGVDHSPQVLRQGVEQADRKSVVEGKSVSVSIDLGGRRVIEKKKTNKTPQSRR